MARNEFETEMGNMLKTLFPRVIRIPDSNTNRYGGFQVSQKPYDYCGGMADGRYFSLEAKRVKQPRFAFNLLKNHQREALKEDEKNGFRAWLSINWRVGHRGGTACLIPFWIYESLENQLLKEDRKSIKPKDVPDLYHLIRVKGGWKLNNYLESAYENSIINLYWRNLDTNE